MALDTSILTVAGSDGVVPVYEPNGAWKTWGYHEIWQGREGRNKYVPKVRDYVVNTETNQYYRVVSHDVNMVPELVLVVDAQVSTRNEVDMILKSGRRTSPDSYRVYLDTSVNPHRLVVDSRFKVGGSTNHHAQIFRGSQLDGSQEVISTIFDQRGELVDTNIPLELVTQDGMNNHTQKCVPPCFTTVKMMDDELVTVVIYNDQGNVNSIQEFYVYNTAVIRQTDTAQKYVKDITLESVFMSEADENLLAYPLNVPVAGLNLFGVVHYSDGTTKRMAVNGTKFSVLGLQDYVSTIIGYEHEFTLKYVLDADETAVGLATNIPGALPNFNTSIVGTSDKFITKRYQARVVEPDGAYTVKLYGFPYWVNATTGYRMEWFLFNLERSSWRKVTSLVRYNSTAQSLNGTLYGVNQRLSVTIDLKQVHSTYKNYLHVQVVDVILQRNMTDKTGYPWEIGFEVDQDERFGIDAWAKVTLGNANLNRVNISLDETNKAQWLRRIWKNTKPMFDDMREAYAPEPDYFTLIVGNSEFTYPISQWNQTLEVNQPITATNNIYVVFHKRTNDTDLFVGMAALPVFIM